MAVRRQVTAAQAAKWPKATRAEKSAILDAVTATTGWHRDHARKAIRETVARHGVLPPRRARLPARVYGEEVVDALRWCWACLDGPNSKRLHAALPALLPLLALHGELRLDDAVTAQLLAMAPATIDRRLAADRAELQVRRGTSLTRPDRC